MLLRKRRSFVEIANGATTHFVSRSQDGQTTGIMPLTA